MNEREMEVLERYSFRAERISRVRGAFLCETEEGLRLLKETEKTEKRLRWENRILRCFSENDRIRVDTYVENRDGELLTEGVDHKKYYVKCWYEGKECSMGDTSEILRTVELLARLHIRLAEISAEFWEERDPEASGVCFEKNGGRSYRIPEVTSTAWIEVMDRHNKEMVRTRNFIRKKHHKSELELKILEDFSYYYEQASRAFSQAKQVEKLPILLYHGDFTHHHVLWNGAQAVVTEFSHMGWGIQQEDFYLFWRKALEKHGWNRKLGLAMLESYESVRPLSSAEKQFLYLRMYYPEKFWKQVNYYSNSKKSWIPLRNLEKLQMLERQREGREAFLNCLKALCY